MEAQETQIAKLETELDKVHGDFTKLDEILRQNFMYLKKMTLERNQLINELANMEKEKMLREVKVTLMN